MHRLQLKTFFKCILQDRIAIKKPSMLGSAVSLSPDRVKTIIGQLYKKASACSLVVSPNYSLFACYDHMPMQGSRKVIKC